MSKTPVKEVENLYKTLVRLDAGEPLVLTLWNFHTYMYPSFEVTPYLWLHSPLRGWGKSNTGKLIAALSFNGSFNVAPTKAALFREISAHSPTYIMDEADELFKNYEIRSMFKVGYKQGGHVSRAFKDGIVKYSVFCPKAIISITRLEDAIIDRCIIVEMKRIKEDEKITETDMPEKFVGDLPQQIQKWIHNHQEEVRGSYTARQEIALPVRAREKSLWRPLFALCRTLCPERERELVAAAKRMVANKGKYDTSDDKEIRLLADMKFCFDQTEYGEKSMLTTKALLFLLVHKIPESPWGALTDITLAKLLQPFDITPDVIWLTESNDIPWMEGYHELKPFEFDKNTGQHKHGASKRGYKRASFVDTWERLGIT